MSGGKIINSRKGKTLPTPMSIHGWTLDSVLAGVGSASRGEGNTLEDAQNWRHWPVGGFTGACNVRWVEDAHDMLVPSGEWHHVKWLRIATTRLMHHFGWWAECERHPTPWDNFPAGALAMLEWEAGRPLAVIEGGIHVQIGLPPDLMAEFWELEGPASGHTRKQFQSILMAQPAHPKPAKSSKNGGAA